MDRKVSIFGNVTSADIRREPFPHIVIENCLPDALYAELERTYPSDQVILNSARTARSNPVRPNSRHDIDARCIAGNPEQFSPAWRNFVDYHTSREFFLEFLDLMGPDIVATYPDLEQRLGKSLKDCPTGILHAPAIKDGLIELDCHICINTPTTTPRSWRRVHTDAPDELFAVLLYFRRDDDRATGADLEIYQWKKNVPHLFIGPEVDEADSERVNTVLYRPNTAVIFINSETSLHAVSVRGASRVSRRLVNIMGRVPRSVPEGLFKKRQRKDLTARMQRAFQRCKVLLKGR